MKLLIAVFTIICIVVLWKWQETFNTNCKHIEIYELDSGVPGPCLGIIAGVHGNEPAGAYTLTKMFLNGELIPKRGRIILIPRANSCGLATGNRYQGIWSPFSPWGSWGQDLNRAFTEEGGTELSSNKIIDAFSNCDLVLDFHEGWGYNNIHPTSIGSTLTPTTNASSVALAALAAVNKLIPDNEPLKKFKIRWGDSCSILTTLGCHMQNNNRTYMLIETSGQNDIQPMAVRELQIRTIISSVRDLIQM